MPITRNLLITIIIIIFIFVFKSLKIFKGKKI